MSHKPYWLLVAVAAASTMLTNCVKIPEIMDGGADVMDGSVGDLGVLNPGPDGSRDVPNNRDDGSVLDLDGIAMGDGSGGSDSSSDGSLSDGSSVDGFVNDGSSMDANGGCVGAGQMICAGACINSQTSAMHCGACGNSCAGGQSCVSGECRCAGAQVTCGGTCVDTQTNSNHCGRCASQCPVGINCVGGSCMCPMMGQIVCGGACVSTQSNMSHCGMCNNACAMGRVCTAGSCQCPAASPQECGGACVNTTSDNNNCGACGTVCGASRTCVAGMCQCTAPTQLCGGSCVNTATDAANCGVCNRACGAGQSCRGGACTCPAGQRDCAMNGTCIDLGSNATNCGACGRVCPAVANAASSCTVGNCGFQCLPGFANCDENDANGCEVNLNNSAANCGACGTQCATGACVAGGCEQWARRAGGNMAQNSYEESFDAAEDPSGNVYFVGFVSGEANFGAGQVRIDGSGAGFIASYTPRGALRWSRLIDSPGFGIDKTRTVAVRQTPEGVRVLIAGIATDQVNLGGGMIGGAGAGGLTYLAEYDENGAHIWSTFIRYNPIVTNDIEDSAISAAGDVYLVGYSSTFVIQGTTVTNPIPFSNGVARLIKLNANGVYQWTRWVGASQNDSAAFVVAVDNEDNVIFGGRVNNVTDAGGGPRGAAGQSNELFIAKYDSNNTHIWSSVFWTNNNNQLITGLAVNPFSNVVTIAGHFLFAIDFGGGALPFGVPGFNTFLANFRPTGVGGRADFINARSIVSGAFIGVTGPARLAYTTNSRLYLHDNFAQIASYAGVPVRDGNRRTVLSEINPASLAVLSVLPFEGTGNNFNGGLTGCGSDYVCVSGRFIPEFSFAMTTLNNSGLIGDEDIFMARVHRP